MSVNVNESEEWATMTADDMRNIADMRAELASKFEPRPVVYGPRVMAGSCRTATDKTGQWAHAVDVNGWGWETALCGKKPGIKGNGWSDWKPANVTCPKCLAKMAKVTGAGNG